MGSWECESLFESICRFTRSSSVSWKLNNVQQRRNQHWVEEDLILPKRKGGPFPRFFRRPIWGGLISRGGLTFMHTAVMYTGRPAGRPAKASESGPQRNSKIGPRAGPARKNFSARARPAARTFSGERPAGRPASRLFKKNFFSSYKHIFFHCLHMCKHFWARKNTNLNQLLRIMWETTWFGDITWVNIFFGKRPAGRPGPQRNSKIGPRAGPARRNFSARARPAARTFSAGRPAGRAGLRAGPCTSLILRHQSLDDR